MKQLKQQFKQLSTYDRKINFQMICLDDAIIRLPRFLGLIPCTTNKRPLALNIPTGRNNNGEA